MKAGQSDLEEDTSPISTTSITQSHWGHTSLWWTGDITGLSFWAENGGLEGDAISLFSLC